MSDSFLNTLLSYNNFLLFRMVDHYLVQISHNRLKHTSLSLFFFLHYETIYFHYEAVNSKETTNSNMGWGETS